jgi:S-adenosylmethionine:tRNA ribosyltransferase-isomerase
VIPARLFGRNSRSGGRFELLLLQEVERNEWWVMLKPGKRARLGTEIQLTHHGSSTSISAKVLDVGAEGHRRLRFEGTTDIRNELDSLGIVPLPPYIARPPGLEDRQRYQTVYATSPGSIAAPTAGLHFTEHLLAYLRYHGVSIHWITLHVGLGTFAPVKADLLRDHVMHEEQFELSSETATAINTAKREGRRVIAIGTTTVRVLESVAATAEAGLAAVRTGTRIFIYPPFQFRVVDALLTNFHLPRSTLLMLVSAFAAPGDLRGRDLIWSAYQEAIRERYRFFSYGDAMLML